MAVTWNSADKSANVTLSGSDLTAATTSAAVGAVRCNTSFTGAVFLYFEVDIVNGAGTWAIGWATGSAPLGTALGTTTASAAVLRSTSMDFRVNNVTTPSGPYRFTPAVGRTICIAFDVAGKLFWWRVGNGAWNGNGDANPATGVGGLSVSALAAGPYFPIFGSDGSGASCTARFGATDMRCKIPAGYSTLDTNTQAFAAIAKMNGQAISAGITNGVSIAKMNGQAISAGIPNGVSIAKMSGMAIVLTDPPNFTRAHRLAYLRM